MARRESRRLARLSELYAIIQQLRMVMNTICDHKGLSELDDEVIETVNSIRESLTAIATAVQQARDESYQDLFSSIDVEIAKAESELKKRWVNESRSSSPSPFGTPINKKKDSE